MRRTTRSSEMATVSWSPTVPTMVLRRDSFLFECIQIVSLCLIWYGEYWRERVINIFSCCAYLASSAFGNVIVKELLDEFPFPLTITLVQLLSIWILIVPLIRWVQTVVFRMVRISLVFPLNRIWQIPPPDYLNQNRIYYFKVIIPLAVGKFLAQLTSHVSLWKVTVSFSHTIKATMPLFTM